MHHSARLRRIFGRPLAVTLILAAALFSSRAASATIRKDMAPQNTSATAEATATAAGRSAVTTRETLQDEDAPRASYPRTGPDPEELQRMLAQVADPIAESVDPTDAIDPASKGCVTCHSGISDPHARRQVGCTDCHGGDATALLPAFTRKDSPLYAQVQAKAHARPRFPAAWPTSANPPRTDALLEKESVEWVKFINPSDLRVAPETCGGCHAEHVKNVQSSMMTHGAMLWGAALYNNGSVPLKNYRYGESYDRQGRPARIQTIPPPLPEETWARGILGFLDPLPRWEVSQPGNILRVFERGGRRRLEVGLPDSDEDPGKPDKGLSPRGLGTNNRTDPVFLGLQKTRLLDPMLSMLGSNDHSGDYRSSGCAGCHVLYANDRDPVHSAWLASAGHLGQSRTADPTIPHSESGHPVRHRFTNAIPTSQCMVCHMHPGTNVVTGYLGDTWWDNESDGELMYPKQPQRLRSDEVFRRLSANPESASLRGLWSDPSFLENVSSLNSKTASMQFADFHGHGWVFRKVYKRDRHGNLLDRDGKTVGFEDADRWAKAVHLKDIHLEKGMHCVDCHFSQDVHGNGNIYGETRNAVEIQCTDCHGTVRRKALLATSGPAAPEGGNSLVVLRTPSGRKRFEWVGDTLKQRSVVTPGLEWTVVQVADTCDPSSRFYSERSRLAKTMQRDGKTWGDAGVPEDHLAHSNGKVTCFACHTSWMTSCFGCHLAMKANARMKNRHSEGTVTRNWTSYNYQVLRDDVFMLGIDGTVTGHRVAPVRSSSAVLVSSQNQNREWIYSQQQTVSAEGFSGQAFNTFVPHTVRATETKTCTDCHLAAQGDNNATMAQLLLLGTNFVNFMGRYIYVGEGKEGFEAVVATEHDEPQAVMGSHLQKLAFPDRYARHVARGGALTESYHEEGKEILSLQLRGEYLYTANGEDGFEVFDVAQIDHKGFSERMQTAPVSPWGQRTYVRTKYATAVALPSTLAVDPTRPHRPENEEQKAHPMYGYVYVTDREEGLVIVGVATLLDGNPMNNFLQRALTFNPGGILTGARAITLAGTHAYISTPRELVIVSIDDPLHPRVEATVGAPFLKEPGAVAVQFRFAFVCDAEGMKVLDITWPDKPRIVPDGRVALAEARDIYVARTYAYVAAGKQGLAIIDVEAAESPHLVETYDAGGALDDARAVRVGSTNVSLFAYVANGSHGLAVLQLTDPSRTPDYLGFSPRPRPQLIAHYHTHGPAIALSKGLDRDRAVDESGNQLAVFGRRGARPFTKPEMERLYLRDGHIFTVTDEPPSAPLPSSVPPAPSPAPVIGPRPEAGGPANPMILRLRFE